MEWLTTTTILENLRDYQNRDAWQRFAQRFSRPIQSFAIQMGLSPADADDVAQETLVAFAESLRGGQYDRSKGRLSRWLFGIAYRQALNSRRGGARRPLNVTQSMLRGIEDEASASAAWDEEWELRAMEGCLEQVRQEVEPTTYRAFELVVQHDRPAADAASELGVPVKLVYNAKHRVLKRLRELRAEFEEL